MEQLHRLPVINDSTSAGKKDSLTGLLNRDATEAEIGRLLAGNSSGLLLIIDLNNFQRINDEYGHMAGDNLLKKLPEIMGYYFFKKDIIGRIAGDKFSVFISGPAKKDFLYDKMSGMQARMHQAAKTMGLEYPGAVIGAAVTENGDTFRSLYKRAAIAVRFGKNVQLSALYFYHSSMEKSAAGMERVCKKVEHFDDLKYVCRQLEEKQMPSAAGDCQTYLNFLAVCRFLKNRYTRTGFYAQLVLISLSDQDGGFIGLEERDFLAGRLKASIQSSLRLSDIYIPYSCCQFLAVLPDASPEHAALVESRIREQFHSSLPDRADVILIFNSRPL